MIRFSRFSILLLIAGLMAVSLFTACRKDYDNTTIIKDPVAFLNTSVQGSVQDTDHRAVINAVVRKGDLITRTDSNGYFYLPPSPTAQGGAPIEISAAGYFTITRTVTPVAQGATIVQVQLIPRVLSASFPSSQGALVDVQGATVRLPQDRYLDATGRPYTGEVQVYAIFLDPTGSDMQLRMPGDLTAVRTDGSAAVLATFGMLGVELRTPAGAMLELASGTEAEISVPLSGAYQGAAPDEIPLWHFQDRTGKWIEEGKAVKQGNRYIGKVTHFSFWNFDIPFTSALLSGTVRDQAGNPVQDLRVRATVLSGQGLPPGAMAYSHTNQQGAFSGYIPAGQDLLLEVLNACGEVIYAQPVPALSGHTTLPDIHLSSGAFAIWVTGTTVNCNLSPLTTPAYVKVDIGESSFTIFPNSDGEIFTAFLVCQTNTMLTATLYNPDSLTRSEPVAFHIPSGGGQLDLGRLRTCIGVDEYIYVEVDNYGKTFFNPVVDPYRHYIYVRSEDGSDLQLFTEEWINTDPVEITRLYVTIKDVTQDRDYIASCKPGDPCDIRIHITENGGAGGFLSGEFSGRTEIPGFFESWVSCTFRVRIPD